MALNFPNNPADGDIYQALGRGWKYNGTAGIWEALIRVNTAFDSDDITEGAVNLYQNPENIQDEVNNLLVAGTNITLTYDDVANTLTIDSTGGGSGAFTGLSDTPTNFTGAAGQYVRVNATETALEYDTLTTADVSEGANLYYTDARVDTHLNQSTAANGEFLKWNGSDYEWDVVPSGYSDGDVNSFLSGGTAGNIVTTGYLAGPATFTIDPAAVGNNTGTVVIAGNLQVDGTTTTINSTDLTVDDINITIASGAANAAAADGAGITIDGAGATLTYQASDDTWQFNKIPEYNGAQLMVYGDSIDVLGNVDITTAAPTDGQALIWDNANSKFIPGDSFSQSDFDTAFALKSVNDLSDVDTTGILDAQILRWNNAASQFEPATPVGVLSDLGDVNNTAPTDGQVLKWDNLNSYWAPADDSVATTLGSIGNVNTTGVANNDLLYYNNSANEWQVENISTLGTQNAFFDIYTADGVSNTYTLSQDPGSTAAVQVFVDGVPQLTNNYTVVGTTLTLGGTPTLGQTVEVKGYGLALSIGTVADASITGAKLQDGTIGIEKIEALVYQKQTFTGDGSTTAFTLDYDPQYSHTLLVMIDNVVQEPVANYNTSSTTLTFTSPPLLNSRIYVRYLGLPQGTSTAPPDDSITNAKLNLTYTSDQFTGDGLTVDYTIPDGHIESSVLVILDGLILPPADYSISGTILTFASAPLLDQSIDIRYMPV